MLFPRKKTTSPYVLVKRSGIHNKGIFAKKLIPEGTQIIEYVGERITKAESDRRYAQTFDRAQKSRKNGHVYIFELNSKHDIDGAVKWNTARWINHSCEPNCEVLNVRGHIWIVALRDIEKGEELSYDYGYNIDDYEEHPCRCGAPSCPGFIVSEEYRHKVLTLEHLKKLKALRAQKRAKKKRKG